MAMTIREIETKSVTKVIEGTGTAFDIKESTVTVTKDKKVDTGNGQIHDKENSYVGSYNYTRYGGLNVNVSSVQHSTLDVTLEVLEYIRKVESETQVLNA